MSNNMQRTDKAPSSDTRNACGLANDPVVSIIIPSFNRKDDLYLCLRSVYSQDFRAFETIVIDDGSTDGTGEMVKKEFPAVELLRAEKRAGVFVTKNLALERTRGKYVWFLDSDSIVFNSACMGTMVSVMEKDPSIGSLGGEVITRGGSRDCRRFKYLFFEDSCREDNFVKEKRVWNCDYLPTCNCFARRSLIPRFELLSADIRYGCEDTQLGLLIRKQGYKNVMRYDTLVLHTRSNVSRVASHEEALKAKILFVRRYFGIHVFLLLPAIEVYNMIRGAWAARNVSVADVKSDTGNTSFVRLGFNYLANFMKIYLKSMGKRT